MSIHRPDAGPIELAFVRRYLEGSESCEHLLRELTRQQTEYYAVNGFHQNGVPHDQLALKHLAADNAALENFIQIACDFDRAALALHTIDSQTNTPYYLSDKYRDLSNPQHTGNIGYPFGNSESIAAQIEGVRTTVSENHRQGMRAAGAHVRLVPSL